MDVKITGISFERGIDRIISTGERAQVELPRDGRLAPSDRRVMPRLDQLLHTATLTDIVTGELAPRIEDRDLLLPDRFHRTLDEVREEVALASARHPDHRALFKAATALLDEERDMRGLLDMFRSALMKG